MAVEYASFGGGCFWCMEPPFVGLSGVISVTPGYMGGTVEEPTYEEVCKGHTGHIEIVQLTYDPEQCSYLDLLQVFWRNIDPTSENQQFADRGSQYQSAIFYHNDLQRHLARQSILELASSGKFSRPIRTELRPASKFYPAEAYHCEYYLKNPEHYQRYKEGSGRAQFLKTHWNES